MDTHPRLLEAGGEEPERLAALATWRTTDLFSDAERSALALTEAVTRIADKGEAVPDEVWEEAADHFGEVELGAIVLSIAAINFFNRINAATRQIPAA